MKQVALIVILCILLTNCAKTGKLSGGPKDVDPPKIDKNNSSANPSLNIDSRIIILQFDEFIELHDIQKNILISPPFEHTPKIVQRGKKIQIEINEKEKLRDSITYSISFGNAIVDFTEGNVFKDYTFLFSTYDKIDSITISGNLVDYSSNDKLENVFIMLYDDFSNDSIIISQKPLYITKLSDNNTYTFENIRNGTFKIIALQDLNYNQLYDEQNESIGFLTDPIDIVDNKSISIITLNRPIPIFEQKNIISNIAGRIIHVFSRKVDTSITKVNLISEGLKTTVQNDSIIIFYATLEDSIRYQIDSIFYTQHNKKIDSLTLTEQNTFVLKNTNIAPWEDLILVANIPIVSIDESKIQLYQSTKGSSKSNTKSDSLLIKNVSKNDSIRLSQIKLDSILFKTNNNEFRIQLLSTHAANFQIHFLPGAITNMYNLTNDTLIYDFSIRPLSVYCNVTIRCTNLADSVNYLIKIIDNNHLVDKKVCNSAIQNITFTNIPIQQYSIEVIEDIDNNGKWTKGNYWKNTQAEQIKKYRLDKLLSGFNNESIIDWNSTN